MAIRNVLDSDVDQLTKAAIKGVNAFIATYQDDTEELARPIVRPAAGPIRPAGRAPARTTAPRKTGRRR
jgi:hypothetical protein